MFVYRRKPTSRIHHENLKLFFDCAHYDVDNNSHVGCYYYRFIALFSTEVIGCFSGAKNISTVLWYFDRQVPTSVLVNEK